MLSIGWIGQGILVYFRKRTKISAPAERYIFTTFSYGCNLPNQMARHSQGAVTSHMISYTNRRHISAAKLKLQFGILSILTTVLVYRLAGVQGKGCCWRQQVWNIRIIYTGITSATEVMVVSPITMSLTNILLCLLTLSPVVWEAVYILDGLLKTLPIFNRILCTRYSRSIWTCVLFPIFLVSNWCRVSVTGRI